MKLGAKLKSRRSVVFGFLSEPIKTLVCLVVTAAHRYRGNKTVSVAPSVSVLTGFDCTLFFFFRILNNFRTKLIF